MKHTILFFVFVILLTNCQQQKTISIQKGTTTQSSTAIVMSIDSTVVAKANTTEPKVKLSKNDSLLKILQEKYGEDYESSPIHFLSTKSNGDVWKSINSVMFMNL